MQSSCPQVESRLGSNQKRFWAKVYENKCKGNRDLKRKKIEWIQVVGGNF